MGCITSAQRRACHPINNTFYGRSRYTGRYKQHWRIFLAFNILSNNCNSRLKLDVHSICFCTFFDRFCICFALKTFLYGKFYPLGYLYGVIWLTLCKQLVLPTKICWYVFDPKNAHALGTYFANKTGILNNGMCYESPYKYTRDENCRTKVHDSKKSTRLEKICIGYTHL